jgi:hypothetical protein
VKGSGVSRVKGFWGIRFRVYRVQGLEVRFIVSNIRSRV